MSLVADGLDSRFELDVGARRAAVAAALRRAARKSRAPISLVSGGGGFRARKGDLLFWRGMVAGFAVLVAAPVFGASLYFGIVASDQYVTETQFSLRGGEPSMLDSLSGMVGLAASQQNLDSQIIVNFIPSRGMAEKLDRALDLRRVYSRDDVDFLSRFNPAGRIEDLARYWEKRVDAWIDPQSSIITVRTRAFTPEDSLDLANRIVSLSEQLVNDMNTRARDDALRASKQELDRAEAALGEATRLMRDTRNAEGVIDASASALAIDHIVEPLQLELARLQQQFAVASRSLNRDSPRMRILTAQIENLKSQIARLQSQVADTRQGGERTLADRLAGLSRQQVDLKLAQQQYATAAIQYENARVDAETQHAWLVDFAPPSLPQKAMYPKRWWGWALIVFPAILLWSALAGLATMVRDHMAA